MVINNYRCYIFFTGDLEFLFNYNNSIFFTFELWLYYIWTSIDVDAVNIYFFFLVCQIYYLEQSVSVHWPIEGLKLSQQLILDFCRF